MTAPVLLSSSKLTQYESDTVTRLRNDIFARRPGLEMSNAYYNGEQVIRNMGISIPPQLRNLHTVVGWPRAAVDGMAERLNWQGFRYSDDPNGDQYIADLMRFNAMEHEVPLALLDSLIYGMVYARVTANPDDITMPFISFKSPMDMTVDVDPKTRDVTAAFETYSSAQGDVTGVLDVPGSTIYLAPGSAGGWDIVDRNDHGFGVVLATRISNRRRVRTRSGGSEITSEIKSTTDAACRTLMGVEVAREFYGAPQRYILGASESAFQDPDGNPKSAWDTYIGRMLALERDEDGEIPTVGQFTAYDPSAYTQVVDMYGKQMVSQTGIPPQHFGLTYEQPASADAMRMAEQRLVSRAESRQTGFGGDLVDLARRAVYAGTGVFPDDSVRIAPLWRDASTPSQAAQSDAVSKQIQSGVLPPRSDVTLELLGYTPEQRARIAQDWTREDARVARQALTAAPTPGAPASGPQKPSQGPSQATSAGTGGQ